MEQKTVKKQEPKTIVGLFRESFDSYKRKAENVSDQEWLKGFLLEHSEDHNIEQAETDAGELIRELDTQAENYNSIQQAETQGISRERWLENKLKESAIGVSAVRYGEKLHLLDQALQRENMELAEALRRSSDGQIMMSNNLDGNIAEHMIARTTELAGILQEKNLKVEVRSVNTANSVDVRATNLDTGKFQNYQMKFGKDAKATIDLIKRGDYGNQRLVVPKEQLNEVQKYFIGKGSHKTISDHIEIEGVKGKAFSKEEMKNLQRAAQEEAKLPTLDDYYYSSKEYAMSIGKNAGVLALQAVAVTTGIEFVAKSLSGEKIEADEMVSKALSTGADTGIKVTAVGTLHVAVKKGMVPFLSKSLSANGIASIAFIGVENAKILIKMAAGEVSAVKGIDSMGRVTTSMVGGIGAAFIGGSIAKGFVAGGILGAGIGLVAGMVSYSAGSAVGEKVYHVAKKIAKTTKKLAEKVRERAQSGFRMVKNGLAALLPF